MKEFYLVLVLDRAKFDKEYNTGNYEARDIVEYSKDSRFINPQCIGFIIPVRAVFNTSYSIDVTVFDTESNTKVHENLNISYESLLPIIRRKECYACMYDIQW